MLHIFLPLLSCSIISIFLFELPIVFFRIKLIDFLKLVFFAIFFEPGSDSNSSSLFLHLLVEAFFLFLLFFFYSFVDTLGYIYVVLFSADLVYLFVLLQCVFVFLYS